MRGCEGALAIQQLLFDRCPDGVFIVVFDWPLYFRDEGIGSK
jgi:hypothetical protein